MARDKNQAPERAARTEALDKKFALENRLGPEVLLDYAKIAKSNSLAVELAKLNEIAAMLWLPGGLSEEARDAQIVKAIDRFNSIKPADGLEVMLAAQMLGTHEAAAECLRRAMLPEQTFEGREMALKNAQKLMTLYTQQLAALDKHRGKGQQKIIVERVTVQSGGQAIVGNVGTDAATSQPEARRRKVAPPQITYAPPPPNRLDGLRDAEPARMARARKPRG